MRWLAGLNHTNGLHYAPYTLPFSFPKPQSHNLTRPADSFAGSSIANVVGERLAMFKHVSQNVRNARHHVAVSSQPRLLPPTKAGL